MHNVCMKVVRQAVADNNLGEVSERLQPTRTKVLVVLTVKKLTKLEPHCNKPAQGDASL